MNKKASLSIVVPCYNEEDTLLQSYDILDKLCLKWKNSGLISEYELLFVNDGSSDSTFEILTDLYKSREKITVVDLRKNVGFQGAITAGLFSASGDMVVTIDADLQDDPEKIEEMILKYNDGFEMVLGVREDRSSDSFFKRFFAESYYSLISKIGIKSVYNHADFRLLSRDIVEELKKFPERVRYLRSLIFEIEPRFACVYYSRKARKLGKSKFSFYKSLSLAIDGITSFTSTPIRLLSVLGLFMFSISLIGLVVIIFEKIFWNVGIPGWASLAVITLFFGGIQNFSIGIVGEYVSKIYIENKARPMYLIRKIYKK
jgi:polyisoprenyl-phosphate glycosyltransferase